MAYFLRHTIDFNNRINGDVRIEMYKKDIELDVIPLTGTYAKKQYLNGRGDKFDGIIASELTFGFWLKDTSDMTYDDFIISFHDDWLVKLYNEGNLEFVGFLTPAEGTVPFLDKPQELSLSANDGLGFLKTEPLTDNEGGLFLGVTTILDYIVGALAKTKLQLNVRTYCNIYESSMNDRSVDPLNDMLNQATLDHKTFQNDDNSMQDCYTTLENIAKEAFSIYQWKGIWVVKRCGEMQENAGPKIWYTEYDFNGVPLVANLQGFDPAVIRKDRVLHAINADATLTTMFALKSAKHSYMYTPWPEIPLNNKFDRGEVFEVIDLPDGGQQRKYTIPDWLYGVTNPSIGSTQPPNGMLATTDLAYRLSTFTAFDVETDREIVLERNGEGPGHRFLRSSPIPVKAGGRIEVTVDFKTSAAGTGTRFYLLVMLEPQPAATGFRLAQLGGVPSDGVGILNWNNTSSLQFVAKSYQVGEDAANYTSFTLSTPQLPATGLLYVILMSFDPPVGRVVMYKNFSFTYTPYIAGSSKQIKGDYWLTSQDSDYRDKVDEEIFISDSPEKIFKGALLRNDQTTLTTFTWRRLDHDEQRAYSEIMNLARINAAYRRFKKIYGTFGGTTYHPENMGTVVEPLGFHQHFTFPNAPELNSKVFELVPPLSIDYGQGEISGTFVESLDTNIPGDAQQTGNLHEFKYIF